METFKHEIFPVAGFSQFIFMELYFVVFVVQFEHCLEAIVTSYLTHVNIMFTKDITYSFKPA